MTCEPSPQICYSSGASSEERLQNKRFVPVLIKEPRGPDDAGNVNDAHFLSRRVYIHLDGVQVLFNA